MPDVSGVPPPPWNWDELSEDERRLELEELAEWVAALQEAYGRWVRLPNCWPAHRALREELSLFWYWRERLDRAPDAAPEEAVRWHQSLRAAAQTWVEAFGGCHHESVGELDEQRDRREGRRSASRPYISSAVEARPFRRGDVRGRDDG